MPIADSFKAQEVAVSPGFKVYLVVRPVSACLPAVRLIKNDGDIPNHDI